MGIEDAAHEEFTPDACNLVISLLSCSLAGTSRRVDIVTGTLVHQAYQAEVVTEDFRCRYGLNQAYRDQIVRSGVRVAGMDAEGEVRAIELPDHPFFIATLFLPQLSSNPGAPHPLIVAYLRAVLRSHLGTR